MGTYNPSLGNATFGRRNRNAVDGWSLAGFKIQNSHTVVFVATALNFAATFISLGRMSRLNFES
jgi:hypothetical protein